MDAPSAHSTILISSPTWKATPWNYNRLVFLRFQADKRVDLALGHGQTVHAFVHCRYVLHSKNVLGLTYLESPALGHFKGFMPKRVDNYRPFNYQLEVGRFEFEEANIGRHDFLWRLTLDEWLFPAELALPHVGPVVFFGHDLLQG